MFVRGYLHLFVRVCVSCREGEGGALRAGPVDEEMPVRVHPAGIWAMWVCVGGSTCLQILVRVCVSLDVSAGVFTS